MEIGKGPGQVATKFVMPLCYAWFCLFSLGFGLGKALEYPSTTIFKGGGLIPKGRYAEILDIMSTDDR